MASLVVIEGPAQGAHFPLNQPLVSIGRDDTCTYQVLDPLVSRQHLQIRLDATLGAHIAADYRSAHGVFINEKQILLDTRLNDGDRIRIGRTTLIYLAVDHPDAPTALAAAKKKDEWKRSTVIGG
ncbi:MAG: FHA domain-containing protein [Phycisphaerales bacterium]